VPARAQPHSRHGWRMVPVAATAAMALLAAAVPVPGVAPELPLHWRAVGDVAVAAYWPEPATPIAQAAVRKRPVREKPARMIDEAVRRRAIEAVERALAEQPPAAPPMPVDPDFDFESV